MPSFCEVAGFRLPLTAVNYIALEMPVAGRAWTIMANNVIEAVQRGEGLRRQGDHRRCAQHENTVRPVALVQFAHRISESSHRCPPFVKWTGSVSPSQRSIISPSKCRSRGAPGR